MSDPSEPGAPRPLSPGTRAHLLDESQLVAHLGSFELDVASGTWRCTAELEQLFGIAPDHPRTVAGWLALAHPDDRPALALQLDEALGLGQGLDREYRIVTADRGELRWVHGLGRVERDRSGRPRRLLGTVQDVSERHRALETLRSSEQLFRALFDGAADALMLHDHQGRVVDVNRAACASLGYTREELLRLTVMDVEMGFPGDGLAELWRRLDSEGVATLEGTHLRKDGTSFPVEVRLTPIRLDHRPLVLAAGRDISARRLAEEALREQRQTISAIVETSQDWIWAVDRDGRHTYSNPAVERILGIAPALLVGQGRELMHPEDRARVDGEWPRWLAERRGWSNLVCRWRHRDGGWRQLESTAVPILGRKGEMLGFRGVDRDITERIGLEERLRQAGKMEAIGKLAGGIAHDFNNQLAGILGFAELLQRRLADPGQRHLAEAIAAAAQRSADLTRELLAFARKGQYLRVGVDLHRVVAETVSILAHSIDRRIELRQRLEAGRALVTGDPSQLQNMLLNLALNARDAMPGGGVLEFSTADAADPSGGRRVRIEVRDTGCGMDDEVQAHLFEPFFTTKPPGKGTGMGLAAVYGTVRNHGGTIAVRSAPGQGTVFAIELPAAEAEAPEPPAPAPPVPRVGGRRILVVDDEPMLRDLMAVLLREAGHEVVQAADGREALERFRASASPFDLVILDLVMPGLDGHDTFFALREADPTVRVLIASGYSIAGEARTLLDAGALGFLQKPFLRDELLAQVGAALGAPA